MAQLHVHYEAAFEDFVRSRGWPYVPVNEHRKAIFGGGRIKSFDYLVYPSVGNAWLVEIKGRKFPYEIGGRKRYWENWVPQEDLEDLGQWKSVFGAGFEPVIVFAYWLTGSAAHDPIPEVHGFRDRHYAFLWIPAAQYEQCCRSRSPKWGTVSLSTAEFRRLAKPLPRS